MYMDCFLDFLSPYVSATDTEQTAMFTGSILASKRESNTSFVV